MNQRTLDTRNHLAQILMEKLIGDSLKEITIAEITAEVGCSRSTFYRHFRNKDDVLAHYFDQLVEEYIDKLRIQQPQHFEDLLSAYFSFWKENESLVVLYQKQGLLSFCLDRYNQKILDFVEQSDFFWHQAVPDNKQLVLLLTVGGCWNILNYYVQRGWIIQPRKLAHEICQEIRKFQFFNN